MTLFSAVALTLAAASPGAAAAPDVHLNQLGFIPDGPKRIIVADPADRPLAWTVRAKDGSVAARGKSMSGRADAASGDHVHLIALDRVLPVGRYRLEVEGHAPQSFAVTRDPYSPLAGAALNYFYQTRAGIPIEARYAGGAKWARPAGHPHEVVSCFAGTDQRGTDWPGCDYRLDVTGGWYDAGDQGKYVVNGGITLWTLQNLYERARASGEAPPFADGTARLPEAGNGANDLLDEARWEMAFLLSMQIPEGEAATVPTVDQPDAGPLRLRTIDAGGMVHHKVADRQWTPLPTPPARDDQPRALYPVSTAATLNLAATAAQCARIRRKTDPDFADRCLAAARRAFAAALRHPDIYAPESFTGSGSYGDRHLDDEFYWAAAELYATTGEPAYAKVLDRLDAAAASLDAPSWGDVAALGAITLALNGDTASARRAEAAQTRIIAAADRFLADEAQSGYHIPYATLRYPWGSNSTILNRALMLALAADFTGDEKYRAGVIDAMDYILGRNPLDQSYVSGFGTRPMERPHHRFWAHSLDADLPPPPPGVLSGGPNSTSMGDPVAETMRGTCAPMRCWRDDPRAFTMNEVAINWNAPLLWIASYLTPSAGE
ncbi:glycoside hydrolase family 9 protein [Stakelama saccharophila]|uniref:Endoglucanase n=1 Tax=Stakelama saccharophila TaxID=3075605 RepID=A0ABZ0B4Q8_9SPHN|nr:glycoside hydrolase family 9 protein [Stakelama sp. W311]WNO52370.1 glycoside hydrolase family 9 protein [Stakelama sp. W311]